MSPSSDSLTARRSFNTPATAFIAPFLVFMSLLEVGRFVRIENSFLPWWRQFPEHWVYPLQAFLCLGLIIFWRRQYLVLRWHGTGLAITMGLVGIGIWLIPPVIYHLAEITEGNPWLSAIGIRSRLDGFDPGAPFGGDESGPGYPLVVGMRFLRLVFVVPLVEEIFWRGFLMRILSDRKVEWYQLPMEQCDQRSLLLTALAFAFAHEGADFVPAIVFGYLAGRVAQHTGNLWAVVMMHAVANLCLGVFIMVTEWWGLW